jgi:hypothetical protein
MARIWIALSDSTATMATASPAKRKSGKGSERGQSPFCHFSCPLSESHLWVALRYVEQNPCRAFMVQEPEDYRWSSAAAHLGEGKDGPECVGYGVLEQSRRRDRREMHTAAKSAER